MKINEKPYKILSLDGGGAWALIQAQVLIDLYGKDTKGEEILADFDLVAANSGGGIVAAALIANLTPAEILDLFLDENCRKSIFHKLPFYKRLVSIFAGPRFSTTEKWNGLFHALKGDATKADNALSGLSIPNQKGADVKFLFMGYDYDRDRGSIFRSDTNSPAANFPRTASKATVIDAVHASSTAPVNFFDKPALIDKRRYWDGGVAGFNNPVLVAVVEAVAYGTPKEHIGVLSIGTGNTFLPLTGPTNSVLVNEQQCPCLLRDIRKLASAIVADPPDTDTFIAYMMLNGKLPASQAACPVGNISIVRMNPLIRPVIQTDAWVLPKGCTSDDFKRLAEMDMAATDQSDVNLINEFCKGWMKGDWLNQPIRHGSDLDNRLPNKNFCEIGHSTYATAMEAW
jgi:hypothetical protein